MPFHKFQASHLFTGTNMLGPDQVLITTDKGTMEAIVPEQEAGEGIRRMNGILSPGFINCHCHLELSHMRGRIPEKTGLVDFVFKVVSDRHFPDEEIQDAIQKAEEEMLQNGIVAVGDICNNTLTLPQKEKDRMRYYNFIEVSGWLPQLAQTRFEKSLAQYQAFETLQTAPQRPTCNSLSPHAPYSVSNELWALLEKEFAHKTITIHNQETAFEDALFINGTGDFMRMYQLMNLDTSFYRPTGKSSLQSYFTRMNDAAQVILVHNTFSTADDIRFVHRASANVNFCVCVNANRYIEDAIPPIGLLRQNQARIVVGTDSLASNWSLSILDELKTIQQQFPDIPLSELLQWATSNGATALQMNRQLGSFEKGKTPGVILLEGIKDQRLHAGVSVKRIV